MSIKLYNYIFYSRSVLFSIYCWCLNPSGRNDYYYVSKQTSMTNVKSLYSTNLTPKDKECRSTYLSDRRIDRGHPHFTPMCGKLDAPK